MATIVDVAAYIADRKGIMATMQLQKLCYYAQAYSLVETGKPLFSEDFQAWVRGPVSPTLFDCHRRKFFVDRGDFHGNPLTSDEKKICDWVLNKYANLTGNQLSFIAHSEKPWLDQRQGMQAWERSHNRITKRAMHDYYSTHGFVTEPRQ